MGTVVDPWTVEAENIQQVWDLVFPDMSLKVQGTGAVFSIVTHISLFYLALK